MSAMPRLLGSERVEGVWELGGGRGNMIGWGSEEWDGGGGRSGEGGQG
jgi:hypothetical protein